MDSLEFGPDVRVSGQNVNYRRALWYFLSALRYRTAYNLMISFRYFGIGVHEGLLKIIENISNMGLARNRHTLRNPAEMDLETATLNQIKDWMLDPKSLLSKNVWVEAAEGSIYVRYTLYKGETRCDLANWDIHPRYQKTGIATKIIQAVAMLPIDVVRIELIHNKGWAEKLKKMQLPGRITQVKEGGGAPTVDFVKMPS